MIPESEALLLAVERDEPDDWTHDDWAERLALIEAAVWRTAETIDARLVVSYAERTRGLEQEIARLREARDPQHWGSDDLVADLRAEYPEAIEVIEREARRYPATDSLGVNAAMILGVDEHPEARCQRCGQRNPVWFVPSPLWNEVMRNRDRLEETCDWGIICPTCFAYLAEGKDIGLGGAWKWEPEERLTSGRYLDLDSPEAEQRLAVALHVVFREVGVLAAPDSDDAGPSVPLAHAILATLRGSET